MAGSLFDGLLKNPDRMGARTQSRNTLGINHPLAESSPIARIPISMIPIIGDGISGYTQEDLATMRLPEETTLFSPLGHDITDKNLAEFSLAANAFDLIPGASIAGAMATLLGKASKQAISSANTSIKQVPALFKNKLFEKYKGDKNVDLGGGKFDLGSDFLKTKGVQNDILDPFNRSAKHNETVLKAAEEVPPDTVTVNNVLNVIQEPEARAEIIQQAKDIVKPGGTVFFQIYEGSATGVGKTTSKGYQNNRKTDEYLKEIQKVFPDAERRGNIIISISRSDSLGSSYDPITNAINSANGITEQDMFPLYA